MHIVIVIIKQKHFQVTSFVYESILGCVKLTVGTTVKIQEACEDILAFFTKQKELKSAVGICGYQTS